MNSRKFSILAFASVLIMGTWKTVSAELIETVDGKYTTKYDQIDVREILTSQRLLTSYIKCLLEQGPCTQEGKFLKVFIPDALLSECSKCSVLQRKKAGDVLSHILQFHRNEWNLLVEKYDKDGAYRKKYSQQANDDEFEYYDEED